LTHTATMQNFSSSTSTRLSLSQGYMPLVILVLLLQSLSGFIFAAEFNATVNRYTLEEGESLELRLQIDKSSLLNKPDYSPLEKDFDIMDVGRSSQVQIINGDTKSSTVWKLALIPKKAGEIIIPAIRLGKLKTQAITINVSKASAQNSNILQTQPKIMVEAVVDKTSAYVQEQIIYTVRLLFQGIQIRKWNLSEPTAGDAIIHPLGDPTQYEKIIGGISYGVLEKRYAVFPQSSGELEVSPVTFAGVINDANKQNYFGRGQQIIKRSQPVGISVQPKNSAFPNLNWLPAKALLLEEQWSPELSTLKVGESATWTLVLKALGQNSSTLPPLNIKLPPEFKTYPDQAKLEEGQNGDGLIGQRSESIAIIATTPGEFELPAVEVSWWNTQKNRLQTTRIPKRSIRVIPAAPQVQSLPSPPKPAIPEITATPQTPLKTSSSDAAVLKELQQWKIGALVMTGLFLLLLITHFILWLRRKPSKELAASDHALSEKERRQKIQSSLKTLVVACKTNDPKHVQTTLLDWGSHFLGQSIHSIGQIRTEITSAELKDELGKLESLLYSAQADSATWDGGKLAELIKSYDTQQPLNHREKEILAPLYPSS